MTPRVRSRWRRVGHVLNWAVVAVLLVVLYRRVSPRITMENPQGAAPEAEAVTLDGQPFQLATLRGKVVVLNFWATWCPPCRVETPGFVRLQREFRAAGVVFVGVSMDEGGAEGVTQFVRRYGIDYPVVLDGGIVSRRFGGVETLPTTVLIDRAGRVRFRHEGLLLAHALRPALEALAREPAGQPGPPVDLPVPAR